MSTPPRAPGPPDDAAAPGLPDYAPGAGTALTDAERWPALPAPALARLQAARDDPGAPVWVHRTGDRLTADDVAALRDRPPPPPPAQDGGAPPWVEELTARLQRTVPRHRRAPAARFADVVPSDRAALAARVADFVPDDAPLDRLLQGTSSGSTGSALVVPLHPVSTAAEVLLLEELLAAAGAPWPVDPDRLGLLSVVDQAQAYTYVSAMTTRAGTLMARVSLHASAWRRDGDRERWLARADPQVLTGPPLALLALARLDAGLRPVGVVTGAQALTPAARAALRERWGAPVLDAYGLKETGLLAVSADGGPHRVVPRRVHVEVLDGAQRPAPDGARGEVVVTVDENPLLPLLRYRTGDTARLERTGGAVLLHDLEGRAPVRFRRGDGTWVADVELTQQLQHHGALAWRVRQDAGGAVRAEVRGGDAAAVRTALAALLGAPVEVEAVRDLGEGKPRRYASAVPGSDG